MASPLQKILAHRRITFGSDTNGGRRQVESRMALRQNAFGQPSQSVDVRVVDCGKSVPGVFDAGDDREIAWLRQCDSKSGESALNRLHMFAIADCLFIPAVGDEAFSISLIERSTGQRDLARRQETLRRETALIHPADDSIDDRRKIRIFLQHLSSTACERPLQFRGQLRIVGRRIDLSLKLLLAEDSADSMLSRIARD